jgi:hypothetical protein
MRGEGQKWPATCCAQEAAWRQTGISGRFCCCLQIALKARCPRSACHTKVCLARCRSSYRPPAGADKDWRCKQAPARGRCKTKAVQCIMDIGCSAIRIMQMCKAKEKAAIEQPSLGLLFPPSAQRPAPNKQVWDASSGPCVTSGPCGAFTRETVSINALACGERLGPTGPPPASSKVPLMVAPTLNRHDELRHRMNQLLLSSKLLRSAVVTGII